MKPFAIGLTGGIGSGKSTVAALFKDLGITVISADDIAKRLVEAGSPLLAEIIAHFGKEFSAENGALDRAKLRHYIFEHPSEKVWLEALLHPEIRREILADISKAPGPYVIVEIPLLLENWPYPGIDRILVVDCEETLQLERAQKRDHFSKAHFEQVMKSQLSRQERLALADNVIENHGELELLQKQVAALDKNYRELANKHLT